MTNFINNNKQSLVLGSVFGVVGIGYLLFKQSNYNNERKQENFYINSINKYMINSINNNNNNNNNTTTNIIITYSSNIPIEIVKRTAKYLYNNINNKVNIFSIEYSEIEHFNDIKEKSTFDAIIVIDDSNNTTVSTHSSQSTISDSNIKKFSKISTLLKPSSPFLTFYYQQQQSTSQLDIDIDSNNKEIVNWNSSNIFENKTFYELCGFKVEAMVSHEYNITNSTTSLCLIASKSPDWLINSIDSLRL